MHKYGPMWDNAFGWGGVVMSYHVGDFDDRP